MKWNYKQLTAQTKNLKGNLLFKSVIVYSRDNCPFCVKSKALLDKLELDYTTKTVGKDITLEELHKELKKQVLYLKKKLDYTLSINDNYEEGFILD